MKTKLLTLIRRMLWPLVRASFRQMMSKGSPLFTYPMLIWFELEGREIFLRGGWPLLRQEAIAHLHRMSEQLQRLTEV